MSVWEGGYGEQAEAELEATWRAEPDRWRGAVHFEDWPENLAGPEYWLYKQQAERER